jgi:Uma2 family endonuclease
VHARLLRFLSSSGSSGVPHYWLLDPDAQRLECWRNDAGTYVLSASATGDETLASPDFEGLTIDLAAIWR